MTGRPNPQSYENQLMQQRLMSQYQSQAEQSAYSQTLGVQRAQAAQQVQQQQAGLTNSIKKATRKPVTLGTILTSPAGLLGNPILSGSKLSG